MMLSTHVVSMPILVGREGEAMLAYPKTQVTKKAVTDSKPVQLGILSGWWMKGWWKQIKLQLNLLRTWWVPWVRVSPHAS